ncbi:hypothetical protein CFAM422_002002 [Trichoderma lentiforme]|uniref:Uncharacterized protein n=1 Tax=Trichoderma lentiforme TaxID=1567552 RepID=A0A9P4XNS0_9HYPO|nr:hypothetical protein CFAM422_002002 [Trichoderma lentiforme]
MTHDRLAKQSVGQTKPGMGQGSSRPRKSYSSPDVPINWEIWGIVGTKQLAGLLVDKGVEMMESSS